jgi:hypothetical protein
VKWERVKHGDWFKEKHIELAIRESHKNGQLYTLEIKRAAEGKAIPVTRHEGP